ncbi:MAG: glycosyltransferase family 2 protein [Rhizorhabdus sp.]
MTAPAGSLPSLDVVIVNYRTGPLLVSCLESLAAERTLLPSLRAIVVDNASPDNSADVIEAAIAARGWDWVTLLRSPVNGGFGAGNNLGIEWALARPRPADLIWLLNPDTRVERGAGLAFARFMGATPAAGIAGSSLLEADGRPWHFAFRFPSVLGEIERGCQWTSVSWLLRKQATPMRMGDACEKVDWVSGASCVMRRELLASGFRFDEGYFLYYEEVDFCLHARRAGWECWFVPDSVVLHIAGQSTGVTDRESKARRLPAYWFESRHRYFVKNHGTLYAMMADLGWIVAHLAYRLKRLVRPRPTAEPERLLRDFVSHSALLPRSRRERERGAIAA